MKFLFLLLSTIFIVPAWGQNANNLIQSQKTWIDSNAVQMSPVGELNGSNDEELSESAVCYLKNLLPDLKGNNTTIKLTHISTSVYAKYFDFEEQFMGTPIFGTSIKLSIDKNNHILSVLYKTGNTWNWATNQAIPMPDSAKIRQAIGRCDDLNYRMVWFFTQNSGILAYDVDCSQKSTIRHEQIVLDANYQILYRNDLVKHYRYPDSLVTMYVFYPDPLTSAKVPYAEPYTNHQDSDVAVLDAQMIPRQTRVSVIKDSFFLENQFLKVYDVAPPANDFTYSKKPVFHYTRDNSSFRDINAYYHLNNWRIHLHDLGYDNLGNTQLNIDASGEYDDESTFNHTNNYCVIYFGIGGIPDAEDADVPTHEYTHFLSFSACPGCSDIGYEREALDEGVADYFAASNSKAISTYNWQKVYNWDGNYDPWFGRYVNVPTHYPEGTKNAEYHNQGQMWSSSLMQIWDSIGRTKTDRVMLETLYGMGKNMTMPQAAALFIKNDSLMYKGADARTMAHYFIQRGFLPTSYMGISKADQQTGYKIITSYFGSQNKVIMDFDQTQTGTVFLYDITGKIIASKSISHASQMELLAPGISSGIYILTVTTEGLNKSFKLLH